MGDFITEGLYNSEVNNYIYYGGEPDVNTLGQWGHFSQIVWKGSGSVGCYTADCSAGGLQNAGPPIPPYFTVCNYSPAGEFTCLFPLSVSDTNWGSLKLTCFVNLGNVLGSFAQKIGVSLGFPTVYGDYVGPGL